MRKKKVNWKIVCAALVCLTSLEIYALSQGVNGALLTLVIAIIAAIAGITIPSPVEIKD